MGLALWGGMASCAPIGNRRIARRPGRALGSPASFSNFVESISYAVFQRSRNNTPIYAIKRYAKDLATWTTYRNFAREVTPHVNIRLRFSRTPRPISIPRQLSGAAASRFSSRPSHSGRHQGGVATSSRKEK
jgi:hypothetical protein